MMKFLQNLLSRCIYKRNAISCGNVKRLYQATAMRYVFVNSLSPNKAKGSQEIKTKRFSYRTRCRLRRD